MSAFISELISSILQIFIFTLIPFIWWFATARRQSGFLKWIGLKPGRGMWHKNIFLWIALSIAGFWLVGTFSLYALKDIPAAASAFAGYGLSAVPAIIIYAVFHTSLSEEILFRGFLLKRANITAQGVSPPVH